MNRANEVPVADRGNRSVKIWVREKRRRRLPAKGKWKLAGPTPRFRRTRERTFSSRVPGPFQAETHSKQQSKVCRCACSGAEAGETRAFGAHSPRDQPSVYPEGWAGGVCSPAKSAELGSKRLPQEQAETHPTGLNPLKRVPNVTGCHLGWPGIEIPGGASPRPREKLLRPSLQSPQTPETR